MTGSTTHRSHAVIVGAGIIGTACAHYLTDRSWRVTLLDRGEFGRGCSHANCGFVCPSHVLPLAEPGAVRRTLLGWLRGKSPFRIAPRIDPTLWGWLFRFARRCNRTDWLAAGRGCHALLEASMTSYRELIERESLDCEWERRGLLFAYRDQHQFAAFAETERLLRETFAVAATRYDGEAVTAFEPALRDGLAGGWHFAGDAHLRPDKLLAAWRASLDRRGVEIRENCEFRRFVSESSRAAVAETSLGEIAADAFVVATGAWTPKLQSELGCRIPIQPGKGYSITLPVPTHPPRVPLIFPETHVAVTPMASAFRLGSTMEFAGYDTTLAPQRLRYLRESAAPFLREMPAESPAEPWSGWRPMTYDGLPIIDRSPRFANVWIAAGHNMLGLSMAPATGRLVADLIAGKSPQIDPAPYCATRFQA